MENVGSMPLNDSEVGGTTRFTPVRAVPGGSWLMGLLAAFCFATCAAASFVLNVAAVPWLVSVPRDSLLGVALGLAPATLPVLLERLGATLFEVDDSWGALKAALFSASGRSVRWLSRVGFLAVVSGLHLYTIRLLADLRGASGILGGSWHAVTVTACQQSRIDHALLVLSLVVAFDGALFYLLGMHELRGAAMRGRRRFWAE